MTIWELWDEYPCGGSALLVVGLFCLVEVSANIANGLRGPKP